MHPYTLISAAIARAERFRRVISIATAKVCRYIKDMRPALILLLITSIFSCPLRCAVGSGCSDVKNTTQVVDGCCNACDGDRAQGKEAPQPECPCDECECQACICQGATVDGNSVGEDISAADIFWLAVESYERLPQHRPTCLQSAGQIPHTSPFVSGRAARIGLQSFQI